MCTITLCENVVDQFCGKLTAGSSRCSSSVLPVAAYNRPIKMITQKRLQKLRRNAQQLKRPKLGSELMKLIEPKYFDTLSLANSIGSGGTIFGLSLIPQGATQSERVGDFAQPLRLILNYSLYVVNSDIVTTVRLIFFRWHIHSAFGPPNIVICWKLQLLQMFFLISIFSTRMILIYYGIGNFRHLESRRLQR